MTKRNAESNDEVPFKRVKQWLVKQRSAVKTKFASKKCLNYIYDVLKQTNMIIRMHITQATANYFLANNVKFTGIRTDNEGNQIVNVTVENGTDIYNIYDAGRCYGRDLPNGF
jgi:hypothetical protein